METAPSTAFAMTESEFLLEFAIVALQRQQRPSRILPERGVTVCMAKRCRQPFTMLCKPLARRLAHHPSPKYLDP